MKKLMILICSVGMYTIDGSMTVEIESTIDSICAEGSIGLRNYITPFFGDQRLYGIPAVNGARSAVVLDSEDSASKKRLVESIISQAQSDKRFGHLMITGVPGVGKTRLAHSIIEESGLEYIRFTDGECRMFGEERASIFMRTLFERLAEVPRKIIILLEDCENWFCLSDSDLTDSQRALRDHFISQLRSEPRKFLLIATSCSPLSQDVMPLFARQFRMKLPDEEVRKGIFLQLLQKSRSDQRSQEYKSWFSWLLSRRSTPVITFDDELFTDETVTDFARRTPGFTGREIHRIVYSAMSRASITTSCVVRKNHVRDQIDRAVQARMQELPAEYTLGG